MPGPKRQKPPLSDYQRDIRTIKILALCAVPIVVALLVYFASGGRLPRF